MDRITRIKLRRLLTELYDNTRLIRQVIMDAGLNTARVDLNGSTENIWHDVLSEAEKVDKVEQLIDTVGAEFPEKLAALDEILGRVSQVAPAPSGATVAAAQTQVATSAPQPTTTAQPATPSLARTIPIDLPRTLQLTDLHKELISTLFAQATKVTVMSEFTDGRTATRVLLVRATDAEGVDELPAVVKLGPRALIEPEWQATQRHVLRRLPGFIPIQGDPVYLPQADGGMMGALRYGQVGDGVFTIQSLARYFAEATLADSWHVLEKRLFAQLGHLWRSTLTWQPLLFQTSYDAILPVNLVVTPETAAPGSTSTPTLFDGHQIAATDSPLPAFQVGDLVQIVNFIVTESESGALTLNLPQPPNALRAAYRLRLQAPVGGEYAVGTTLPLTLARVTSTRADLLRKEIESQLGGPLDLTQAELPFADSTVAGAATRRLPNPLLALPALLARRHEAKFATIHGDLNLRNILVDTEARTTHIIDCAAARQDHALHDLLRLERDFLTAVLAQSFFSAGLPPTTIVRLYQAVHCAMQGTATTASEHFSLPNDLPVILHQPFVVLVTLRRAARDLLATAGQWDEYYTGLMIHLLGALKYRDLDHTAGPQPKALLFWAAAVTLALLREMETSQARTCRGIDWRFFDVTKGDFTEASSKGLTLSDPGNSGENNRGALESYTPPAAGVAADLAPVQRRLDVAAPQQATLQRAFSLAVAVRQPSSPLLQLSELPATHSGQTLLDWPADARFVRLRAEVIAPECTVVGESSHTFKLYPNLDSEVYYFSLIPQVTGRLNIIVRLYQKKDMLGSASAYTVVGEQVVSALPVPIRSETVTMKLETEADQPGEPRQTDYPAVGAASLKILFLAANPLDTVRLRTDEEARAIDLALRQAEYRHFDIRTQPAVRIADLPDLLMRHTPDILHFSGHGSPSHELLFHDAQGKAQPAPREALSRLFRLLRGNIRCLILNACYTEEQARAIAEVIDCVVGIDAAISDEASLQFATAFYRALGYGKSVQEAFALGQLQIELAGLGDAGALHLMGANAGQLRFVSNQQLDKPAGLSQSSVPNTTVAPAQSTREPTIVSTSAPGSGGSVSTMTKRPFSVQTKMQLAEALLACPTMASRQTRDAVVNDLPDPMKGNIRRNDADRADVVNIITTALNYTDGLEELVTIVRLYEGDSLGMQAVERVLATLR